MSDNYKIFYMYTHENWVGFSDKFTKENPQYEYVDSILEPMTSGNKVSFVNYSEYLPVSTETIVRKVIFRKKDKYNDNN